MTLAKRITLVLLTLIFLLVSSAPLRNVHAEGGKSIPAWLYEVTCKMILNNEESSRNTGGCAFANAAMDYGLQALTKCPSDGLRDYYMEGGSDSCIPVVATVGDSGSAPNGSIFAYATTASQAALDTPPPVSLAYFWDNVKKESIISREAHAAGPLDAFDAVLLSWTAMRNIAYGILAAFVMVVAIMIAMRKKIDAQTVVTAQSAIPRIIVSAVLIAFSYPLAAFFVDLIAPATKVAAYTLLTGYGQSYQRALTNNGELEACPKTMRNGPLTTWSQATYCLLEGTVINTVALAVGMGTTLLLIVGVILYLLIIIASLFVYCYNLLKIMILTIMSPLIFAVAAIPGQEYRIVDWLKDMLAAALALPVMYFFLMLGVLIAITAFFSHDNVIPGSATFLSQSLNFFIGAVIMTVMGIMALKAPFSLAAAIKGPKKR